MHVYYFSARIETIIFLICIQLITNLIILGHYVIVPKKVPEFVVPDLSDFEVSFHIHFVDWSVWYISSFSSVYQYRVHPMISYPIEGKKPKYSISTKVI